MGFDLGARVENPKTKAFSISISGRSSAGASAQGILAMLRKVPTGDVRGWAELWHACLCPSMNTPDLPITHGKGQCDERA